LFFGYGGSGQFDLLVSHLLSDMVDGVNLNLGRSVVGYLPFVCGFLFIEELTGGAKRGEGRVVIMG